MKFCPSENREIFRHAQIIPPPPQPSGGEKCHPTQALAVCEDSGQSIVQSRSSQRLYSRPSVTEACEGNEQRDHSGAVTEAAGLWFSRDLNVRSWSAFHLCVFFLD